MNEDDKHVWLPNSFMTAPNPDLTPNTLPFREERGGTSSLPEGDHTATHDSIILEGGARTPHSKDPTSVRPPSPNLQPSD